MEDINSNLESLYKKIAAAALRVHRNPQDIRLVAVSKRMPAHFVKTALACGQKIFGENYLQDAQKKIEEIGPGPEWHFIGHIQSNKAKNVVSLFDMIHTVDREKLARAINSHAGKIGKKTSVLVQVNVGKEEQKAGVLPEQTEELLKKLQQFDCLLVKGLMTMPPYRNNPEDVRPYFRALREIAEQYTPKGYFHQPDKVELSMGMSHDFEVAIEEGATLIRVGTAIFGPRPSLEKS
ncbi:MAG: YggS family pyridoxal phosphate-dependent enzyme [Desulfobulbaceae bacterium]|uniref:Pyridoxal phosphate homeostasis protein n=1 Tax=Candidatus Desulfobia pelagia TaxID=2841692 RepID=A0A8J6NA80_9BACT|nr:YggS family pyridoxal phosphate-dependent enzyme [Candidatus Desulfobia pelagia]